MKKPALAPLTICAASAGAVVAVDRMTKAWVLAAVGIGGKPIAVIDGFFYIACHRNSGMAWGLFQGGRVFFVALTAVLLVAMAVALAKFDAPLLRAALSLAMGGAVGNFIDRVADGSVVDFLDFYIFGYNFPTFNAADSALVVGAALIAFHFVFAAGKAADEPGEKAADEPGGKAADEPAGREGGER